jgi:hypothetical protein
MINCGIPGIRITLPGEARPPALRNGLALPRNLNRVCAVIRPRRHPARSGQIGEEFLRMTWPVFDSEATNLPYWARICKPFKEPRNRFQAWRARTITLFVVPAREGYIGCRNRFFGNDSYTVKVRLLESIFTRYMALFKVPWCIALETPLKRPRQDTCHS